MKLYNRKHPIIHKILCAFLPERCPYCDSLIESGELYCDKCRKTFTSIVYKKPARGGFPCISAVAFTDNFAEAVKRFKFNNRRQYAFSLAWTMAEVIAQEYKEETFDLITYVPIHKTQQRNRGYNQCELLAAKLSVILKIPVKSTLIKVRNNQPQHTLKKATEREKNVKGAFKVKNKTEIQGKRILLIDDIITTGNTLGECAKALYNCKPADIHCATFAVAVVKNDLK